MRRPGFWPSPAALLLLRAALWDADGAAGAWRRATATIDLDTLDPGAARLLPLAQQNVRRLGLDDPWADRVRGIHRYWWAHNRLLLRLCREAIGALERAGIQTLVLKGVPIALRYYDDPGLRPMSDVDILVRPECASDAITVLGHHGWAPEKRVDSGYTRLLHGVSLHDDQGRTIDLHWAIHEDDVRPGADADAWATAVPLEVEGAATRMLAPAALLVHALAAGAKWAADPAVRWVADATLIIRRGDVDWQAFTAEAERRRFVVRARACLAYLRAALQVEIPDDVMERLEAAPVTLFERLEHQLRTRTYSHFGELPRYWLDWQRTSADAWRDPLGFAEYLRHAWDLPSLAEVPAAAARRGLHRLATGRPIDAPGEPSPLP